MYQLTPCQCHSLWVKTNNLSRPKTYSQVSLPFMKWRTGHPIFGQHSASTIQKIMSGGSSFLPFCHSKTDNISFKLNLAFWTTLTSGLFAANLDTWDPPEHRQKFPSGSNSHLRQNIMIYLGSNSVVSLSNMLNAGSSVTSVARSLKISRQSVYRIKAEIEVA